MRNDPYLLFVRRSDLLRQIRALRRWGYRFVTFGELARRTREGEGNGLVALTFDDGLVDNLTLLVPLLKSAGIPATVFIVSGWLGEPHPDAPWTRIMGAKELKLLSGDGVEIGGHSLRHAHMPSLAAGDAERDMRDCRVALEGIIDRPIEVFAYPFGDATPETMAACEAAGYRAACRSSGLGSWAEPFNLPRQAMGNRASTLGLRLKRDARYERLVHTVPGRLARRAVRATRVLLG